MECEFFEKIVNTVKQKKPILFGLEHDQIVSVEKLEEVEKTLGTYFSEKYKKFVTVQD